MRNMLALTGAAFGLVLSASFGASAQAGEIATRCSAYGCDHVDCHDHGNSCTRYSDYDSYYNGYTNGTYGGYDNYAQSPSYDNGYYGGYDNYAPSYDNGYYGGYSSYSAAHLVCDNEGSRCYNSYAPYWDYHEYYRIHGYHWNY